MSDDVRKDDSNCTVATFNVYTINGGVAVYFILDRALQNHGNNVDNIPQQAENRVTSGPSSITRNKEHSRSCFIFTS
jgi:hypothetical protein